MGKKNTHVDDVKLLASHRAGAGLRRLSREFGMSKTGIAKRLKSLGATSHPSPDRKIRTCQRCGIDIWGEKKIFCSRSCSASHHSDARKKFRNCAKCGKSHKNRAFCSYACSNGSRALEWTEERLRAKRLKTLLAVRRYQAQRYRQTPPDADHEKIREFYANCPPGHEVDHKVPISRGGLHHQDNLQYLPVLENRRKSNKLDYTPVAERLGT